MGDRGGGKPPFTSSLRGLLVAARQLPVSRPAFAPLVAPLADGKGGCEEGAGRDGGLY